MKLMCSFVTMNLHCPMHKYSHSIIIFKDQSWLTAQFFFYYSLHLSSLLFLFYLFYHTLFFISLSSSQPLFLLSFLLILYPSLLLFSFFLSSCASSNMHSSFSFLCLFLFSSSRFLIFFIYMFYFEPFPLWSVIPRESVTMRTCKGGVFLAQKSFEFHEAAFEVVNPHRFTGLLVKFGPILKADTEETFRNFWKENRSWLLIWFFEQKKVIQFLMYVSSYITLYRFWSIGVLSMEGQNSWWIAKLFTPKAKLETPLFIWKSFFEIHLDSNNPSSHSKRDVAVVS